MFVDFNTFKMALALSGIGAGMGENELKGFYEVSLRLAEKGDNFDLRDAAKIYVKHGTRQPKWDQVKIKWVESKKQAAIV